MSFIGELRQRRREINKQVKAAKAKAKEEARQEAKLKRKAQKAEFKAAKRDQKHQQKLEIRAADREVRRIKKLKKQELKLDNRALKRADKLRRDQAKDERKALAAKQKYQTKMAEKILAQQKAAGFNKDKVKSWIGGGRILIPVLVPLAYRAITGLQQRNLDGKAKKFGVTSGDAARFQGYGAPLRARIEATRESLKALDKSNAPAAKGFIKDANSRLDLLAEAVASAEKMTPDQRRRAHQSMTAELDGLDRQIITELGV